MNLPTNNNDPRQTILRSPMGMLQIIVVFIAVGLNALDGFDVMSISFASNGILREWHITRAVLGAVLSMELIGMAVGSVVLGGVADRIGRRPTVLGCLVLMTVGMLMATHASGVYDLSVWRVLTGLGIGGVLAAVNAITAEFANARRRDACVSFMSIGYPLGAVFGGVIVSQLLKTHDWRSVFYFGSAFTATLIPLVWFLVPESVHWLARKQPVGALNKINRAMKRMGYAAIDSLPPQVVNAPKGSVADIFAPALVATTVILTLAYFFHVTTFYFILKWVPNIIHTMGFPDSSAAGVLTWANVGGAAGGALFGVLTQKLPLKPLTIVTMVLATVGVIIFGHSPANLNRLSLAVRRRRIFRECRHRRHVRHFRAGVSDPRACVRHRLGHRRRSRWRGPRTLGGGLAVPGRPSRAGGGLRHGHGLDWSPPSRCCS